MTFEDKQVTIESGRKTFEDEHIYYRQFLDRNNDGSYELEWVDSLWRGWCMAVTTLGLKNEP
jgi:hypothetical protein